jgi:hypothetical protein
LELRAWCLLSMYYTTWPLEPYPSPLWL